MPTFLVTNDDGIDSPLLVPLARAVGEFGEVRVVVPDSERSWIGKAISRFDVVGVAEAERHGLRMHAVRGTPADCVNLGVHTLYDDPPDFVVSGVNLGLNFGSAFFLSSGTVGAALEACIAGVPAVAFSLGLPADAYGLTGVQRLRALGERPALATAVAGEVMAALVAEGFPAGVDCFTVDLPESVTLRTPRVVTRQTRCRYGPLFVPGPESGYLHRFKELIPLETPPDGDVVVVRNGAVAITPIRLDLGTTLPDRLRRVLERTIPTDGR